MKRKTFVTIAAVFLLVYIGSYFVLRAHGMLFFYKEVEYFRGIAGPAVTYSIASQTNYLHYVYYFPALVEEPFSWKSAHLSVREGGDTIQNLGSVKLSKIWYLIGLFLVGFYVYEKKYH